MKKIAIILASLIIFAGFSYAGPVLIQQKAAVDKKEDKKADKKEVKKVPSRKKQDKKTTATK